MLDPFQEALLERLNGLADRVPTLRDQMAMRAMESLVAVGGNVTGSTKRDGMTAAQTLAAASYDVADAMLEAKQRGR